MKRTIAYVDGSNLYYGLLRGTANKWLDLTAFVKKQLNAEHDVVCVKYFASRVIDKSKDHHKSARQDKYFDAIRNYGGVELIEGYYRERKEYLQAATDVCLSCEKVPRPGFVRGYRATEMLTDVNIATALLQDAYEDKADAFVIVSGDSDLSPAARIVRYATKKQVIVLNPQRSISNELRRYSTLYRNLEPESANDCLMPRSFSVGDGRVIHCPEAWIAPTAS